MRKPKTLIGIDPDIERSGIAIYESDTDKLTGLHNLTFFELLDFLRAWRDQQDPNKPLEVYVEAGWLNSSNWHTKRGESIAVTARKGKDVGQNHQVGKKIVEMCDYLKITHQEVRPCMGKRNDRDFRMITKWEGKKPTNQEQRDAGMLVFREW